MNNSNTVTVIEYKAATIWVYSDKPKVTFEHFDRESRNAGYHGEVRTLEEAKAAVDKWG